jgi:hypothetical protein
VDALASLRDHVNASLGGPACSLDQTGGMCCACRVSLGETCLLVTEDEEHPGRFYVGEYRNDDEYGEPVAYGPGSMSADDVIAYVEGRLED